MKVCAFTGHRKLYGYDFDELLLERVVENLAKQGVDTFLCGMAVGFDLKCAQTVLALKGKYGVRLVACVPCPNQSARYGEKAKRLYDSILSECDETAVISPEYTADCMHRRDRYLVDNCDVIVSFLRKNSGGTFYTVNYARERGKKIIEL